MDEAGAVYLLDKPEGETSRKSAGRVCRAWGYSKYGHSGTLDPDATGLLIVLMGKATRLSRFLMPFPKRYGFGMRLGIRTDTDDTTGEILERNPVSDVSEEELHSVLRGFTGDFQQRVPEYSAVRVKGRRAYDLARRGLELEMPLREVSARDWKLESIEGEVARLSVTVSSGTYIRALARDIGNELGTGAAAFDIRRTEVGGFSVEEASRDVDSEEALISMASAMRHYPRFEVNDQLRPIVTHGGILPSSMEGIVSLLDGSGRLLAVARGDGGNLKPLCVLRGG
jgi:tRNA pseudouridine55 synthase